MEWLQSVLAPDERQYTLGKDEAQALDLTLSHHPTQQLLSAARKRWEQDQDSTATRLEYAMLLSRSKRNEDKREAILHFEHILETLAVIPTVAVEIPDITIPKQNFMSDPTRFGSDEAVTVNTAVLAAKSPSAAHAAPQSPTKVEAMYVCNTNECLYNLALTHYGLGEFEKSRTICEQLYAENPDSSQFRTLHRAIVFKTKKLEEKANVETAAAVGSIGLGVAAVALGLAFALGGSKKR